jgi:arylsulfatase A-like enzyme
MVFHQAYASNPLCSPSRAAIMTGMDPARIGITFPFCHLPEVVLEKGLEASSPPAWKALQACNVTRLDTRYHTLAESFKTAGYINGHFGKWHLGREPYSPLQQGFDVDIPHTDAPGPLPKGFFYPFPVWPGHGKPGDNLEDSLAEEAVKFIHQHKDQPFFLNYWAFQVHSPWQAKDAQIEKYRKKADPHALQRNPVYAGMVETLDDAVGRIVSALEETGALGRTIIVFTSDNGPYFVANKEHMPGEFSKVPVTSAQPLRAGKQTIHEGGLRVPLVVVWPGVTRPGSETDDLVANTDFFPTFADMLGLEVPAGVEFDGVSQRPVFEGGPPPRDEFFCHFPHRQDAGRNPHQPAPTVQAPASILRKGDWKLIRYYLEGPDFTNLHELYYLKHDPGERTDLASRNWIPSLRYSACAG